MPLLSPLGSPHVRFKEPLPPIFDEDFVNEEHVAAFANALSHDPSGDEDARISAMSDFAPVHQKIKKRRKKPKGSGVGWGYELARWPLLLVLFFTISTEFFLYVLVRQIVNAWEWLLAYRGRKGELRKKLRQARSYEEWKEAALKMDEFMGLEGWKKEDGEGGYYDVLLVRKVLKSLRELREDGDAQGLVGVLEVCLKNNFAGTESPRLYSETFYGTKYLVEDYVNEVRDSLAYIRQSPALSLDEKKALFKGANKNFGGSALCLSGGGSFGYYHFGVLRAFLDADLLPRVITGTSAGGLVAALCCTRTDAELRQLLRPELANRITACEEPVSVWIRRWWKMGARFDTVDWARKATFFTYGSLTFREAYERTGRALNISVTPSDRHSPTKVLNYLTAPDCIIWSAIIASAAVPGILSPVVLMRKHRDGTISPFSMGSRFKDGSIRVDIPLQSLNLLFNVNHAIVSQVNPHVHLFFFAPRGSAGKPVAHRRGKGWRGGFLLAAAEQYLKLELNKNLKVIRDLELMPQILATDFSSVFLQKFDGSITIWPKTRFWDWIRILSDPDPVELDRMMHVGQLAAWPRLHLVENRMKIEREILAGRQAVRDVSRRTPVSTPSLDASVPAGSAAAMPVSSDAEAAFARSNHSGTAQGTLRKRAGGPRDRLSSLMLGDGANGGSGSGHTSVVDSDDTSSDDEGHTSPDWSDTPVPPTAQRHHRNTFSGFSSRLLNGKKAEREPPRSPRTLGRRAVPLRWFKRRGPSTSSADEQEVFDVLNGANEDEEDEDITSVQERLAIETRDRAAREASGDALSSAPNVDVP